MFNGGGFCGQFAQVIYIYILAMCSLVHDVETIGGLC